MRECARAARKTGASAVGPGAFGRADGNRGRLLKVLGDAVFGAGIVHRSSLAIAAARRVQ